jgi:hypothetical protein
MKPLSHILFVLHLALQGDASCLSTAQRPIRIPLFERASFTIVSDKDPWS